MTPNHWYTVINETGPIKRSVTISGHRTSIALEPEFWDALRAIAESQDLAINELVRLIDAERTADGPTRNLSSAIRVYVLAYYKDRGQTPS